MDGKLKVLVQLSARKAPATASVPSIFEFATNEEQRQILQLTFAWGDVARPIAAPPGTPLSRVSALRKAFGETTSDPKFLADAEKLSLSVGPVMGDDVASLIASVYRTPAPVIEKVRQMIRAR
jgi:tripartite-type tricarboxylate transporter receptor subunit TctC